MRHSIKTRRKATTPSTKCLSGRWLLTPLPHPLPTPTSSTSVRRQTSTCTACPAAAIAVAATHLGRSRLSTACSQLSAVRQGHGRRRELAALGATKNASYSRIKSECSMTFRTFRSDY